MLRVMCIRGHEDLLIEGSTYTVVEMTNQGNYILEEVEVPEGFTSFSGDRFAIIQESDLDLVEQAEEDYWVE